MEPDHRRDGVNGLAKMTNTWREMLRFGMSTPRSPAILRTAYNFDPGIRNRQINMEWETGIEPATFGCYRSRVAVGKSRGRMNRRYSSPNTAAQRDCPAISWVTAACSTPSCTMSFLSLRSLLIRRRISSGSGGSFASLQRIGSRTFRADEELKDFSPLKSCKTLLVYMLP
jgi:hypothetical protein